MRVRCWITLIPGLLLLAITSNANAYHFSAFAPNQFSETLNNGAKDDGQIWVLLVAGSNGWYNYRHQADVCHAYHVIRRHGVPKTNIITMMYDDIANDSSNPYPGKLYNVPDGKDVYAGVKIDYLGLDVTPHNFLAILHGNQSAVKGGTRRVIESSKNDRIFVYFSDHGGVGIIAFPDDVLTVTDLNDALKRMYKLNRYSKLVFYMEACESGSMFARILPKNINVYAVTASNSHESSWGCYCKNKLNLPCLGDCFSINWIVDAELEDVRNETLKHQFQLVKQETNLSHVMHYGDYKISHEKVAKFMGGKKYRRWNADNLAGGSGEIEKPENIAWPSREIYLQMLEQQLSDTWDKHKRHILREKIKKIELKRDYLEAFFESLVLSLIGEPARRHQILHRVPHSVINPRCHSVLLKQFHTSCFHFGRNPYALKYAYVLANLCAEGLNTKFLQQQLFQKCSQIEIEGIH